MEMTGELALSIIELRYFQASKGKSKSVTQNILTISILTLIKNYLAPYTLYYLLLCKVYIQ